MKNKNRPRRTKPKPKKPTRQKPFNLWVAKYFDLNGEGIERRGNGRCNQSKKARNNIEMQNMRQKNEAQGRKPSGDKKE
jgi:hypothetical protein